MAVTVTVTVTLDVTVTVTTTVTVTVTVSVTGRVRESREHKRECKNYTILVVYYYCHWGVVVLYRSKSIL